MKSRILTLLMLTAVGVQQPVHAVTKAQAAGAAMTREDEKAFSRLFDAIAAANVAEVETLLRENERLNSFIKSNHSHKGFTALTKVDDEMMKNRASSLTRGEKAAVTKKLNKIKAMLEGDETILNKRSKRPRSAQLEGDMRTLPVMPEAMSK